jgi:hypothetical protein
MDSGCRCNLGLLEQRRQSRPPSELTLPRIGHPQQWWSLPSSLDVCHCARSFFSAYHSMPQDPVAIFSHSPNAPRPELADSHRVPAVSAHFTRIDGMGQLPYIRMCMDSSPYTDKQATLHPARIRGRWEMPPPMIGVVMWSLAQAWPRHAQGGSRRQTEAEEEEKRGQVLGSVHLLTLLFLTRPSHVVVGIVF